MSVLWPTEVKLLEALKNARSMLECCGSEEPPEEEYQVAWAENLAAIDATIVGAEKAVADLRSRVRNPNDDLFLADEPEASR